MRGNRKNFHELILCRYIEIYPMSEVGFDSCGCFWPGGESKIQHGIVGPLESGSLPRATA